VQSFNAFLASSVHVAYAHVSRPARYADGPEAAAAMLAKAPEALAGFFALIEAQLADGRPFVHGDDFTISDPYLFVMTGWVFGRTLVDPKTVPRVASHHARISERPAVLRVMVREAA
jgi:glutathione S-transferase